MKSRILTESGVECPQCGKLTQVRTHKVIKEKQLKQPYYFSKWFYCINEECKTTQIMLDEFKVENKNEAMRSTKRKEQDRKERKRQVAFLRNL